MAGIALRAGWAAAAAAALTVGAPVASSHQRPWGSMGAALESSPWEGDVDSACGGEDGLINPATPAFGAAYDAAVHQAQASASLAAPTTALPRNLARAPVSTSRPAARTAGALAAGGLASVPYMIGDTGAGTCIGFTGLVEARMSHPSLSCGRLNVAEANSPLPMDRVYYSYRHFHNSNGVSAFQYSESVNYDRHTLAGEKTLWGGVASLELRVPVERRLTSNITTLLRDDLGITEPLFGDARETDIGNLGAIFKCLLWESSGFALSGGLGVRLPTARDVNYDLGILGPVTYTQPPGLTANQLVAFIGTFENETVYLEPFLAWLIAPPGSRWFHQGFFQVEVAANPSTVSMEGGGIADFFQNNAYIGTYGFTTGSDPFVINRVETDLFAQTLMRLNLGTGYRLFEDWQAPVMQQLTLMFEGHYTTTLQRANLSSLPLNFVPPGTAPFQEVQVGNLNSRVDIVNIATGVSGRFGNWTLTNGFIAPVRRSPNRGFDFEYNLQAQRAF